MKLVSPIGLAPTKPEGLSLCAVLFALRSRGQNGGSDPDTFPLHCTGLNAPTLFPQITNDIHIVVRRRRCRPLASPLAMPHEVIQHPQTQDKGFDCTLVLCNNRPTLVFCNRPSS